MTIFEAVVNERYEDPHDVVCLCGRTSLDSPVYERRLPNSLRLAHRLAVEEMITPNPLTCANIKCETFIPPANIKNDYGLCKFCGMKTCEKCKALKRDHLGRYEKCPDQEEDAELDELAATEGWKRCPKCYTMTERAGGCNVMR